MSVNSETTLRDVLLQFRQDFARVDFKEVSKYKWNQVIYDPVKETFADFLKILEKRAKQAFGEKDSEFVETFLFGKLPIQLQHQLSTAEKADSLVEEIKTFKQTRF